VFFAMPRGTMLAGPGQAEVTQAEVGGWTIDPHLARSGCFLPDLTRLARDTSAANLPQNYPTKVPPISTQYPVWLVRRAWTVLRGRAPCAHLDRTSTELRNAHRRCHDDARPACAQAR